VSKRSRWLIGYISEEEAVKPLHKRKWTWSATFYWHKPGMGKVSAVREARERGCPLPPVYGGRLVWYPVWPQNEDGKPRRVGSGSSRETGRFDWDRELVVTI